MTQTFRLTGQIVPANDLCTIKRDGSAIEVDYLHIDSDGHITPFRIDLENSQLIELQDCTIERTSVRRKKLIDDFNRRREHRLVAHLTHQR